MNLRIYTLAIAGTLSLSSTAMAQSIRGITNNDELFTINNAAMPTQASTPVAITGIVAGQSIVGIDYRPNTGELYALGYNTSNGNAQLYTINTTTAAASAVGAAMTLDLGSGGVGFDFNPTVDRIRVTAANQKNYRLHPVTGAIAATDGNLAYAAADVNSSKLPNISASAYTNSYIGSEATTLFNYDEALNIITTQIPPNDGIQNTIGGTGIVFTGSARRIGMDIYFDKTTNTNIAYLSANAAGSTNQLYTVNLATGVATLAGVIGAGIAVKDITVTISRELPALSGQMVYALTKNNGNLISFDSKNPSIIRSLMPVTGITTGQKIVGMDFRPANRQLYALGYNYTSSDYQLYTVNTETGLATAINAMPGQLNLSTKGNIGFDFNPVPDRIRVVGASTKANYRLHPETGAIAATDSSLSFTSGDNNEGSTPYIGTVGYTNSYAGATATTLFGLDDSTGTFVNINPPNDGKLNTLTANFLDLNPTDITTDMDIYYDSTTKSDIGFLAANTGTAVNDDFYTFSATGSPVLVGRIGNGIPISDIAVKIDFTNSEPVSIKNVNNKTAPLNIYPNPATDLLQLGALPTDKNTIVTISDLSGKVLITATVRNNIVPISTLAKGMYVIHVSVEGGIYAPAKFVKK